MKKTLLSIICFSVFTIGCSTETEVTETSTETSSSTTTSQTEVILNVIDAENNIKPGYTVMMFQEKPSENTALPTIEMQVVSDSEGIAKFNLNDYIVSPKKLYFEAFIEEDENFYWKSITHPSETISKGKKYTTSIIVE